MIRTHQPSEGVSYCISQLGMQYYEAEDDPRNAVRAELLSGTPTRVTGADGHHDNGNFSDGKYEMASLLAFLAKRAG